ncbi:MAG: AMP-binding protein [Hydrogenophaga sp.]|uniref:class I adenylate-forming enzyme family protein n=1 Tax=Hydrogenophaga sp. TaxID=1904254 RepID=UPI002613DA26|nr:AMP-binding protein [Hydrogenophaga sp.]MCW5670744.1 AMP-binding protein [Hydrogenophaga sp.]
MLPRDMIRRCAQNYPNKTAYLCGNRSATWRQMHERSDRFAVTLQKLGHRKDDTVAILTQETIEVYEHFFACMKIGAPRVGLNTQYAWPEMLHVLEDSDTRYLLVEGRCKHLIAEHLGEIAALGITLIGYGEGHGLPLDYEQLLAQAQGEPVWPTLAGDDVLFISYTSGTTGVPKGVLLTHEGGANCILHSLIQFGFSTDDVWYMPAASAWVVVILNSLGLGNGMTMVLPDGAFQLQNYLHDVERFKVTVGLLVPTMLQRAIAEVRANPGYDLSSLRMMMYGSSPATPKLIRDAKDTFKVALIQTYAMTEATGGWISYLTDKDHDLALREEPSLLKSVGRIGIHYDCTIRDGEGAILPPGEVGEVWLRGNTLMKGYRNLPEATAEALPDGWLRTNDIGRLDERGYLYLMDRQKFLIITGAVNVFPTTVEAVLVEHPAVEEVAVVGVPHPEWGEAVVAAVVKRAGHEQATAAELIDFCHGKLSRPETPKHVVFVDTLPKTSNAKLKKNEIKAWLSSEPGLVPWNTQVE